MTSAASRPSVDELHDLLICDAEAGHLIWKRRPVEMFGGLNPELTCRTWNGRNAGKRALCTMNGHGYLHGAIFGRSTKAHSVIWAMHHGTWASLLDHINGDKTDNRIANLRQVSVAENARNTKLSRVNTSGHQGVHWDGVNGAWVSKIKVDKRTIFLGRFREIRDAVSARKDAEAQNGFHPNHGRAA